MSPPATHSQRTIAAEHYSLRFPYRKSVKIRRDLRQFDEWSNTILGTSIGGAVFRASLYKIFFLTHVALYPTSSTPDSFIPAELDRDLQRAGLKDPGALSCNQAAVRILAVICWQQHRFKVDPHALMRELIPFYRQLRKLVGIRDFTYKNAAQSAAVLNVFKRHELPGADAERDLVILLMTWAAGCTPRELINLSWADIDALGPLDWIYLRQGTSGVTAVKLEPYTILCITNLIATLPDSMVLPSERLLNCRDGIKWRALTENEIEMIIERHYRFARALYGFDHYVSPSGRLASDFSPSEEAMLAGDLKQLYDQIMQLSRARPLVEHHDDDWDAVILKKSRLTTDAAHETKDSHESNQIDWDAAITKHKRP